MRGVREDIQIGFAREHPSVEIAAGPSRGGMMECGIDEIGSDLEALHAQTAPAKCGHDAGCDRGLADAAVGSGDDNACCAHGASLRGFR